MPTDSWSVRLSSDAALNFWIYVGCAYGFIPKEETNPYVWPNGVLREEGNPELFASWKAWWSDLLQQRAIHAKNAAHPPMIRPPDFPGIENPALRVGCVKAWPSFSEWWFMPGGGQAALYYWEGVPNIQSYVRACEEEAGRKIRPFTLTIDLVYGGLAEALHPAEHYCVMPAGARQLLEKGWWLHLLGKLDRDKEDL